VQCGGFPPLERKSKGLTHNDARWDHTTPLQGQARALRLRVITLGESYALAKVSPYSESSTIHYSEATSAQQHGGIARKHLFPTVVSFRLIVYWLLLQLYCLACAPESAFRAAMLSRAVCFSVSDCVCARCASSCLPSLPLPPCDALARSW
jgi:hypothetical protein